MRNLTVDFNYSTFKRVFPDTIIELFVLQIVTLILIRKLCELVRNIRNGINEFKKKVEVIIFIVFKFSVK